MDCFSFNLDNSNMMSADSSLGVVRDELADVSQGTCSCSAAQVGNARLHYRGKDGDVDLAAQLFDDFRCGMTVAKA
jgi:hypothetical protein